MDAKQAITEEQGVHKQWYEEARKQTLETLPAFMNRLLNSYQHDYGTIVHAVSAGAIAAAWASNEVAGITGFQAGVVMWQFIREWNYSDNKCGLRILNYDNMLFPQFVDQFKGQGISAEVWEVVQKEAAGKIKEHEQALATYAKELPVYEQKLAAYKATRPDYDERPDYYNHLSMGNGKEWEAEQQKIDSGFEFAPREPHTPRVHPNVMNHWVEIVDGQLPFGMSISND